MIEFRAVTKRFDDGTIAVDELDLTVEAGTITVFVGPSGCGKTTSLRMVNRMIDPTTGTILVDGKDVLSVDPPTLRRGIGYVIQQAGLFPHRTVLDNVATVPLLSGWEPARGPRPGGRSCWSSSGLPTAFGKRYPHSSPVASSNVSGVARALAADPPVLLMDEPFSAVDPVVRAGLQDELLRLQGETRQDDRVRDPRHRRGAEARRPGRGVPHRRRARAVRQARGAARAPRRTTSSRPSSDATAATGR